MINNRADTNALIRIFIIGIGYFVWVSVLIFHTPKYNVQVHLFKSKYYLWNIKNLSIQAGFSVFFVGSAGAVVVSGDAPWAAGISI